MEHSFSYYFFRGFGILIAILLAFFLIEIAFAPLGVLKKTVNADNIITNYEQFQNLYNTCERLNNDLGNMRSMPENDKMFEQFSKAQRINTLKTQLNRWVEDYNAKSQMLNRSLWKSDKLPYQLNVNNFSNYN